jgi:Tol biopolymer transport system component
MRTGPTGRLIVCVLLTSGMIGGFAPRAGATFPGLNGHIAFDDYMDEEHVYVINPDGTGLTDLTPKVGGAGGFGPAWSPDGNRLAFWIESGFEDPGIYVVDIDHPHRRHLVAAGGDLGLPAWSPDGTSLVFSSSGKRGLFLAKADGSSVKRLTFNTIGDREPDWSPDGSKIAFVNGSRIWVLDLATHTRTALTTGHSDNNPSWSPDGTMITFDRMTDVNTQVFTMNADGTEQVQVTHGESRYVVYLMPAWSPDGTKLVVSTNCDWGIGLSLINPDGSGESSIFCQKEALNPSWQSISG